MSTINELGLPEPSVQYVHFPFDWTVSLDNRDHIFHPTVEEDSLYERLATRVAGVDREQIQTSHLLANSNWTADVVEDAYGTRPRVLHPPIDTSGFTPTPWDQREEGLVTVGRIEKSKRIVELIRILDRLFADGHDLHLHVIGPTVDEEYRARVERMAAEREYVILEGEVPRETVVERLCNHKYGIHGKRYEHFGMAVAEIAAAGAIPFVPANGGPHAIVHGDPRLTFEGVEDAVETIAAVVEDPSLQRELRRPLGPREIRRRFGRERFQRAFRRVVEGVLDEPASEVPAPVQAAAQPTA